MFQIVPLSSNRFSHLYALSGEALKAQGIVAEIADSQPGFPCRVSLRHAAPGERVLLLNHAHQPADTPYRASHAIYVRDGAETVALEPGELPDVFTRPTTLSVRAFDAGHMIRTAELIDSSQCAAIFDRLLDREDVAYLQVHFAKYGCFAASVVAS